MWVSPTAAHLTDLAFEQQSAHPDCTKICYTSYPDLSLSRRHLQIQKLKEAEIECEFSRAVTAGHIQTGFAALKYNSIEQPHLQGGVSRYTTRPKAGDIAEKVKSINLKLFLRLINSEFSQHLLHL